MIVRRVLFRSFLVLFAALFFLGAALLSPRPTVPPNDVPTARDVGAMQTLATGTLWLLRQNGPGPLVASRETAQAAARVAAYSRPDVRAAADIRGGMVRGQVSIALAPHSWLNIAAAAEPFENGADPHLRIKIGSIPVPAPLTHWVADRVIALIWTGKTPPPTFAEVWPALQIEDDNSAATATFDVPQPLVRGVQRLLGLYSEAVAASARATYLRLTGPDTYFVGTASLGAFTREAFGPDAGDLSRDEAAGRLIGMLMASSDPEFIRLAGTSLFRRDQDRPQVRTVTVEGRTDLVAHFLVSAALTANGNRHVSNAIGEVKELSDSLAGGSGFSFVDLTADRAGTRLGELLSDPRTTRRTQERLAEAHTEDLFPMEALALSEGLSEEEFEARYEALDAEAYRKAVARIDAALDRLPLYHE